MVDEIEVVDYDSVWPEMFAAEATRIRASVSELVLAIEHFGSTAVPGLASKPIIDILVIVRSLDATDRDAGIVPGIEIAWRLAFDHWGHGYATEAARAALDDGSSRLHLRDVIGVTTPGNVRSRRVMERLGMVLSESETFEHPLVPKGDPLRTHVVYRHGR